jgi:hypothetical protein
MLAFYNTVPHFRITYTLGTTLHLSFTDLIQTGYSSYGTLANVKGICSFKDPDGIVFYQNAGWSLTAPSFTAADIDGNVPTWAFGNVDIPLTSSGLTKPGEYEFKYIVTVDGGNTFVIVTKTYTFDFLSPNVVITYDLSCATSELTSTDETVYDVVSGGVLYSPSSTTRTHTIKEPLGSGFSPTPGSAATAARTVGGGGTASTDLWTKTWQTTISTVVSYNLATWGAYTWIVVNDTVTGQNHIDVECDDCDCDLRQCMLNLFNRWLSAKNGNKKLEQDLQTTWLEAVGYWVEYTTAKNCGLDTSVSCQKLKDLLASVDCSCDPDTSDSSVRIVAISAGTGGVTPSTFVFWVDTTNPSGGNPGDIWYNSTTYIIYQNVANTWVAVGTIQGATGPAGADGANATSASVLFNEITDSATPAGTGNTKLKTYAVPANTMVNNGDYLLIRALFQLGLNDNGKTLQICFNGDVVATHFTDALINASTKYVELVGIVHRKSVIAQLSSGGVSKYGGFTNTPVITAHTATLTANVDVDAYGQNTVASASDIICKQLSVELHSKMGGSVIGASYFDQGIANLVGTVSQTIAFATTFGSTLYTVSINAYDGANQPIAWTVSNKTVYGFDIISPDTGTAEWSAILI